jgi:hypothetical protein
MGLSVTRLGVCYDLGLREPALYAWVVFVTTMLTPFFLGITLPPTTKVVCFRWVDQW